MKYVPAPAVDQIRIRNLFDAPMFNGVEDDQSSPDFGKPKPWFMTYQDYLLSRTADEAFLASGGKKEGIDAVEILQLARIQIRATAKVNGVHAFDDEVAKRLREAITKPKSGKGFVLGTQEMEHNFYDWVMLWKAEPKSNPPAVLQLPDQPSETPTP